ncbi:hypothetical protein KHQ81_06620 [Mycoplasmatota bacterium]|nr:hypothetical protein KHQ81_06620 [Mycoplasmatota bacterium]
MKKILNLVIIVMITILLSGCQLVTESKVNNDNIINDNNEKEFYIPVKVKYDFVFDNNYSNPTDMSEYISWSYNCEGESLSKKVTCSNYGKSFTGPFTFHNNVNYENGILENTTLEYSSNGTVYYGEKLNGIIVYPKVIFTTEDGSKTKVKKLSGLQLSRLTSLTQTITESGEYESGEIATIKLEITFESIDVLKTVEVKEYNDSDEYIKSTIIKEDNIIDELVLSDSTDYVIIKETYEKENNVTYVNRKLLNKDDYYHLKFLNEIGLVENNSIHIIFPE